MSGGRRSQRPVWLGADTRQWDHARLHLQMLEDARLGADELAVYFGLAAHAEVNSGEAFPAAATVAGYINRSERQVRYAVKTLERCGYLRLEHVPGKASRYYLQPMPAIPEDHLPDNPRWSRKHAPPSQPTPAGDAGVQPEPPGTNNGVTPAQPAGHPGTMFRASPAQPADELEPSEPQPPNDVPPTAAEPTAQDFVTEYVDGCSQRPPTQFLGQLGRTLKGIIDDDFGEDVIHAALAKMRMKGLSPSALPSLVNEVVNKPQHNGRDVPEHLQGGTGRLVG